MLALALHWATLGIQCVIVVKKSIQRTADWMFDNTDAKRTQAPVCPIEIILTRCRQFQALFGVYTVYSLLVFYFAIENIIMMILIGSTGTHHYVCTTKTRLLKCSRMENVYHSAPASQPEPVSMLMANEERTQQTRDEWKKKLYINKRNTLTPYVSKIYNIFVRAMFVCIIISI